VAFLLYSATAPLVLWLVHRFVRSLTPVVALVLFTAPLTLVGPALVFDRVYGPIDHLYQGVPLLASAEKAGIPFGARNASAIDVISEFFPWRRAVQASLERREWPLWNGYNLAGHPLAEEAQSAPFSPFTIIACVLPAAVSMTFSAAIGFFLAALSAFLFARELECGVAAALFAGLGWMFGASNVVYILTAMGLTTVYMPLMLCAARRVVWRPNTAAATFLAATIVLTAVQGHPESLFLNVLVAGAYALFELARRRAAPWRSLAAALGGGLAGGLLSAIVLLPVIGAIPQSIEYIGRGEGIGSGHHGVVAARFVANLITDVFPRYHLRYWNTPVKLGFIDVETAAVGSLALAFAVYGVWRRRSAETWFFAAMALACAIIGARWSPIANALQHVPLLNITHHERLAFAAALFIGALSALGFQTMVETRDARGAARTLSGVLVLLLIGMWWLGGHFGMLRTAADYGQYRAFSEIFFLLAAVILLTTFDGTRLMVPGLLLVLAAQRWTAERETFETYRREVAYPPIPILEPLKNVREPFRIVGRGDAFPPAMNTYYGLEDARGYEALTLDSFERTFKLWSHRENWYNRVDRLSSPFLSFLNVRYALQSDRDDVPDGWRTIASQPGAVLLENDRVIDRVFVPRRVVILESSSEDVVLRMVGTDDFREVAWITAPSPYTERTNGPGRIVLRRHSTGGRYAFDADMAGEGYVVISESAWKGWQARVDGHEVRVDRANSGFLAIPVPAGRHAVDVEYEPRTFVIGRAITVSTFLLLTIASLVARIRRRRAALTTG
jgi:hypothetical protein